ncbi:MAG: PIG-L deacetylase family protein, partial [Planctomycetota bacterium]
DGLLGDPDGLPKSTSSYAEMRRRESRAGLAELGIDDVTFWGFPDGFELSETDIELGVRRAAEAIRDHRPDVVYLPWEREGHPDHHALFVVVTRALDRVAATHAPLALGYEVWNAMIPDVIVDTTTTHEQKRRAMLAHASQIAYVRYEHAMSGLSAYRSLVHLRGRGYGEALCLVRGTLPAELADRDA